MKNITLYATLILVLAATACQVLPVGSDGITDKTRNLAPSGGACLHNGDQAGPNSRLNRENRCIRRPGGVAIAINHCGRKL